MSNMENDEVTMVPEATISAVDACPKLAAVSIPTEEDQAGTLKIRRDTERGTLT